MVDIVKGAYYKRRDGRVVGPAKPSRHCYKYPWVVGIGTSTECRTYTKDGLWYLDCENHDFDLTHRVNKDGSDYAVPEYYTLGEAMRMMIDEGKVMCCGRSIYRWSNDMGGVEFYADALGEWRARHSPSRFVNQPWTELRDNPDTDGITDVEVGGKTYPVGHFSRVGDKLVHGG